MSIIKAQGSGEVSTGFYPYNINQSLRFNDDDSAYLNRTPASASNQKTWTWSGWVKRGNIGGFNALLGANSNGFSDFSFNSAWNIDGLSFFTNNVSGDHFFLVTTQVFRDPSAWYHIVLAVDTTQATASNRAKIYVNGNQITAFNSAVYQSQNSDTDYNNTVPQYVGSSSGSSRFFDGYLAEVNFIDGTALTPSSFGETKDGIWVPKDASGLTFGTNGFHLDFNGNTNDASGNGNDWTANNISAHDYVPDSPTNNFATLNSLANAGSTFSEGNLKISFSDDGSYNPPVETSTFTIPSSGKWYFEGLLVSSTAMGIGVQDNTDVKVLRGSVDYGVYYLDSGNIYTYVNGTDTNVDSSPASYTTGDIIGVAYNADTNSISWYKNGVLQTSYTPSTGYDFTPAFYAYASTVAANFGQDSTFAGATTAGGNTDANNIGDFAYPVPAGYLSLCSASLPTPTIVDGSENFNTVLFSGSSASEISVTGVGFQPEFVWDKNRNSAWPHLLWDVVRGTTKYLSTNSTGAEVTDANSLKSFDADGFTVGAGATFGPMSLGNTHVAWNWKAGGAAVSNTAGSITSQVSANTDAGFSIVSWVHSSTTSTIGHGLTTAPNLIILKSRTTAYNWDVGSDDIGWGNRMILNSTAASSGTAFWNSTAPTSSVFTYAGSGATNGDAMIAYCFANTEGFSKAGSYTGNGSTDGPFIWTGGRVQWLMIKETTNVASWYIQDSTRDVDNPVQALYPIANDTLAENSSWGDIMDLLSNGFKPRVNDTAWNRSGGSYIYLAFAEHPFKYANAK
jgi:hypothetical protein